MTCFKWTLLLVVLVGCIPRDRPPVVVVPTPVVKTDDGCVLFWQEGLLVKPIVKHTGSNLTHAAILLDGYVYEAVPPCVHKVLLKDYVKEMQAKKRKDFKWFIMEPNKPYTPDELTRMRLNLDSQLGRPYMLRGWWKGHEVRGIFCSQLVGNALAATGRIKSGNFRESPGSLYEKILPQYTSR